jgi:hypothetical protein
MVSHIHNYSNIYCFFIATIVTWTKPQCYVIRTSPLVLTHIRISCQKLRVARDSSTVNYYVCRSLQMTVVCTKSTEECETAWLRQSLQTDLPVHQYVCLQNFYNYTTQKHY